MSTVLSQDVLEEAIIYDIEHSDSVPDPQMLVESMRRAGNKVSAEEMVDAVNNLIATGRIKFSAQVRGCGRRVCIVPEVA